MKKTINIEGMSCNHCKMRVEKALNAISDVTSAIVNLEAKTAEITSDKEIEDKTLAAAIEDAGFVMKG